MTPNSAHKAAVVEDEADTTPHSRPSKNPFPSNLITDDEDSDNDEDGDGKTEQLKTPYRDALLKQNNPKLININEAHRKFGHCNPSEMKALAKVLNLNLTGKLDPWCPACLIAKSQQNRTKKQTVNSKPVQPGELLAFDLTGKFPPDIHHKKYMAVACDGATGYSWRKPIGVSKTELKFFVKELLQDLKKKEIKVR